MNRGISRRLAVTSVGALMALGLAAPGAGASVTRPAAKLAVSGTYTVSRQPVTVTGRSVRVRGVVRPFVAGEKVVITASIGRHVLRRQRLSIRRSAGGSYGYFTMSVASSQPGDVTVSAGHHGDPQLGRFTARESFAVLADAVSFGARGRMVELLQQRLQALHLYLPSSGVYDSATGLALDAYHRLLHWGSSQSLDRKTLIWLLNGWGAFPIRYPKDGKHAEGNLGLQLLALIDSGKVQEIYPISSGKPSTPTVLGRFRVYQKTPGYLPDGMYFSNFFYGGYAIHGYDPAPDYPASHGCMRVPIPDAISIYNWLGYGDGVDVYY